MRGPARAAVLIGAGLLAVSLFLPWSHQFSAGFLARFAASPALRAVPRNPDAWQLFTFADVLLALLAVALTAISLSTRVSPSRWLSAPLAIAAAFTLHALAVPPTDGANIFDPARGAYAPPGAAAGVGETVAIIGLAVAALGVLLAGRRRA